MTNPGRRPLAGRARSSLSPIALLVLAFAALWAGKEAPASRAQPSLVSGAADASFYNGPADCCESGPRLAVDAAVNA